MNPKRLASLVALAATMMLVMAGSAIAANEPATKQTDQNIVEVASGAPQYSTLVSFVQRAGLVETLSGEGPFTVLAPTNNAFGRLAPSTVRKLQNNRAALRKVLLYHVIAGEVMAADVVKLNGKNVTTAAGIPVQVRVAGGKVYFKAGARKAARVIAADIPASNGVIHGINRVLIPPTILGVALNEPRFSTLVTLVEAAGLKGALASKGPLTLLAPTNAAFAKLPQATVDALLADRAALRKVLLYHVIAGNNPAATVVTLNGKHVPTLEGQAVAISVRGGKVYVNRTARVVTTDIGATNGVIHAINEVLIPPHM